MQKDNLRPKIRTRFAPSPTGKLHLGGARTALFNWLIARSTGGTFCVRIEDTDQKRFQEDALSSILNGLDWLGFSADEPIVFQSKNRHRHIDVAQKLYEKGAAYWCDMEEEALTAIKEAARVKGKAPIYPARNHPRPFREGVSVLRFKMPEEGVTSLKDRVQGDVEFPHNQLDDLVLLRSDGSPTYMLSVVVDDHDMDITDVIRGVDHLSNTPKQILIYQALGWNVPRFAHIPLIHGPDGAKLSKRHGALDIGEYRTDGFLKEALLNALLRLGWGHQDQELFTMDEAITLFSLEAVGRSAARFDPAKLEALNARYLRARSPEMLLQDIQPFMDSTITSTHANRLLKGLPSLAMRAQTLKDLALAAGLYSDVVDMLLPLSGMSPITPHDVAYMKTYQERLKNHMDWTAPLLEEMTRAFAKEQNIKLGSLAAPLRLAMTGQKVSPPLFEVMAILGPDLSFKRLASAIATVSS